MSSILAAAPLYPAGLSEPPRIDQIAVAVHGANERERYHLPGRWCLHFYTYEAEISVDGVDLPIRPGYVGVCPAGADMRYHYRGRGSMHAYAHFRMSAGSAAASLPAMQDLGPRFAALSTAFGEAIGWHATAPRRAEARLWDVLWELAVRRDPACHALVEQARHHIEMRLSDRLSVAGVASVLGCSHNHLTRLFQRDLRITVVGYIRNRRAQRARHLLRHSTMAIGAIAAEVGIRDPHLFNKVIRRELGKSPRGVREAG